MNSGSTKTNAKPKRNASPPKSPKRSLSPPKNPQTSDQIKDSKDDQTEKTELEEDDSIEGTGNMAFTKDYYIKAFGQFDDLQPIDDDLKKEGIDNKEIDELQDSTNTFTDLSNSAFEDETVLNGGQKPSPLKTDNPHS